MPIVKIVNNAIRANAAHGFIYLNNPKVGCSTIKAALWHSVSGAPPSGHAVHRMVGSPFTSALTDAAMAQRAFVFTFVRNPFQRVVSAYLNKVAGKNREEWLGFARRLGLDDKTLISFDGFVEVLSGFAPELLNPHWRPQHLNTLHPFVRPNLLADLEQLDALLPQVLARLFPDQTPVPLDQRRRSHATTARQSWRDLLADPATRARVLDIYAGDFNAFGYCEDIAGDPASPNPVIVSDHRHDGLAKLVTFWTTPGPKKPAALKAVEAADKAGALADWILAQRLRYSAGNPVRRREMLERHASQIAAGPQYLTKIAAEVTTGKRSEDDAE